MEKKKKPNTPPKRASSNKKEPVKKKVSSKKENPDLQFLANRIRELRKLAGYTNADFFAYEHGWSRSHYGRLEISEDIRFTTLMKLCKDFGIHPRDFFSTFPEEGFNNQKKDKAKK